MGRLQNKVAIITGAAQGMGAEHARRFVVEDARVVVTDIDIAAGEALANELGSQAVFTPLDVTDDAGWLAAVKTAITRFGEVSILVNNAGIIGSVAKCADLASVEFERICAINQTSVFLGTKHVIPSMLRAGGGSRLQDTAQRRREACAR